MSYEFFVVSLLEKDFFIAYQVFSIWTPVLNGDENNFDRIKAF